MRGPLAVDAEIARRVDDAGTEVAFPDAIDDHARGDRVRRDRVGEPEPSAALLEQRRSRGVERAQEMRRHFVTEPVRIAAQVDAHDRRLFGVADAVDVGVLWWQRGLERL